MSYDLEEKSRFEAKPVECYFFELGSSSWSYTTAEDSVLIPGWNDPFDPAPIVAGWTFCDEDPARARAATRFRAALRASLTRRSVAYVGPSV